MRQYKFRGKRTDGVWVYGTNVYIPIKDKWKTRINGSRVDPETVDQYTGLRDRNGKEIYEGDIITVRGNYPRVVLWDKVSWAIMPCELYNDKHFWIMNLQHPGNDWWEEFADEMEIIGNIHDNPELMGNEQSKI